MTQLQDFLNTPIANIARANRHFKQGDLFGVELECEGRNVDFDGTYAEYLNGWAPHNDGSLRNNHGSSCEWVFNGPAQLKPAIERVERLFKYFEARKAKLVTSNRTSTHVHYNMGDKNVYQLVNVFILFTILENLFDRYCGEDRCGNLFCLSSRHAEEQVGWMMKSCFKDFNLKQYGEQNRYCSLNLASIHKFGTVEFRGMRGLDNKEDVIAWLGMLDEFCSYACYTMANPVKVIEDISLKSPRGFLKEIFSADAVEKLTRGMDEIELNASIYEGLRLVQMLCYKIGTEFDRVHLRGRDFWASLKEDQEPVLDIEEIAAPAPLRGPRGNVEGADPVGNARLNFDQAINAFINAAPQEAVNIEMKPQRLNPFDRQARFRQQFGGVPVPQHMPPVPAPEHPRPRAGDWVNIEIGRHEEPPKAKALKVKAIALDDL